MPKRMLFRINPGTVGVKRTCSWQTRMLGHPDSYCVTKVGELGLRERGYHYVRWCHKVAQLKY
jgi:hypothetical protein